MYKKKTIAITFLIFLLLNVFLCRLYPMGNDLNRSNRLLDPLVLENKGVFSYNDAFLHSFSILHNNGQVLASYRRPKWKDVVDCESDFRHYDDSGQVLEGDKHLPVQAYGIAQFQIRTFKELKNKAGRPELYWKNKDDQIWLLKWALKNGYGEKWSCY